MGESVCDPITYASKLANKLPPPFFLSQLDLISLHDSQLVSGAQPCYQRRGKRYRWNSRWILSHRRPTGWQHSELCGRASDLRKMELR